MTSKTIYNPRNKPRNKRLIWGARLASVLPINRTSPVITCIKPLSRANIKENKIYKDVLELNKINTKEIGNQDIELKSII